MTISFDYNLTAHLGEAEIILIGPTFCSERIRQSINQTVNQSVNHIVRLLQAKNKIPYKWININRINIPVSPETSTNHNIQMNKASLLCVAGNGCIKNIKVYEAKSRTLTTVTQELAYRAIRFLGSASVYVGYIQTNVQS